MRKLRSVRTVRARPILLGLSLTLLSGCGAHTGRTNEPDPVARDSTESAPAPITEARRKVERLYRLGAEAAAEKRNEDATRYWEIAWTIDPNHPGVAERLGREYRARGMEAWADGRIADAITHWRAVLRVIPGDERARGYIQKAYELDTRLQEIVRESEVAESDD